jgi:hypothetical protein
VLLRRLLGVQLFLSKTQERTMLRIIHNQSSIYRQYSAHHLIAYLIIA